ncbi:uncharacterized protein LOC113468555 [Diaphorina citri]|uniref:Uncharacterized protein LOC113468555 n=1 Tax=Diaphorina citri TaxID=121845 RepID=A0A3Q0IYR9_DIACI|nr:uncharacterized protein LOC113468555 [Diaphorina citri]
MNIVWFHGSMTMLSFLQSKVTILIIFSYAYCPVFTSLHVLVMLSLASSYTHSTRQFPENLPVPPCKLDLKNFLWYVCYPELLNMANLLFINHIPTNMSIDDLECMFKRDSLNVNSVNNLGCHQRAILTCPDQSVADRLIDKYNGRIFHGIRLVVEPWVDLGAPISRQKGISADSLDTTVNMSHFTASRSKTSMHPSDFPEYSNSRTREFAKEKENYGKFSFL